MWVLEPAPKNRNGLFSWKSENRPTLFIIPKKSLFLPPREWKQNIIEGSCSPKGDFKTFSPFQSLLILKKPYFDLLSNSSKNLKGILIVFPAWVLYNGEKTLFPLTLKSRQGIYTGKYFFPLRQKIRQAIYIGKDYFFPLRQKIRQAIYIGKDYFSPTLKETDRGFTFPLQKHTRFITFLKFPPRGTSKRFLCMQASNWVGTLNIWWDISFLYLKRL